ncbi:unnamed protein product [Brassica rapa subsp. trilocularis]
MWVDDKNRDYVVVRRVSNCQYLGFLHKFPMAMPRMSEADEKAMYGDKAFSYSFNIGVPTSGVPLFLYIRAYEPTS